MDAMKNLMHWWRQSAGAVLIATLLLMTGASVIGVTPAEAAVKTCTESTPAKDRPILRYGDRGECVKVAQRALIATGFLKPNLATGNYLGKTLKAVRAFQRTHVSRTTGVIGSLTWVAFTVNLPPSAVEPGDISSKTQSLLGSGGRVIDVNKTQQMMRVFDKGTLTYEVAIRIGGTNINPKTGQPFNYYSDNGSFRIGWKSRDHVSRSFNAPMPFAMFYNGGEAIHFSPDFNANGYGRRSHGCINISDPAFAEKLFDETAIGTPVIVHGNNN